jgi:hypothetical protein
MSLVKRQTAEKTNIVARRKPKTEKNVPLFE